MLSLYDPDRSQAARRNGEISAWQAFVDAATPRLDDLAAKRGAGLWLMRGPMESPTLDRQMAALQGRFPEMRWTIHDPLDQPAAREGARTAFGRPIRSLARFADADVIVTLDSDPLGPGPLQMPTPWVSRKDAGRARPARTSAGSMRSNSTSTLTGANADHRVALPPSDIAHFAVALARALGAGSEQPTLDDASLVIANEIGRDLAAHHGRALVLPGATLSAEISRAVPLDQFGAGSPA